MSQPVTVHVGAPEGDHPARQYSKAFKAIGIAEIVFGSLSIVLEIAAIAMLASAGAFNTSAPGIWDGIFVIITGILALLTSSRPDRCRVVAGLVLACLCIPALFYMLYYEATFARVFSLYNLTAYVAVYALLALCALGGLITAIVHVVFGSKSTCCA